jgi:hypothetical protein
MSNCVRCGYPLKPGFNSLCRNCYYTLLKVVRITETDFIDYLSVGFKCRLMFPSWWRFPDVHRFLVQQNVNLKPLSVILESILFLKAIRTEMLHKPLRKKKKKKVSISKLLKEITYIL